MIEDEKQAAWNKQIADDMRQTIATLELAITGKGDTEKVRPMIGDARPMPVAHWKQMIARNRGWIAELET